MYEKLIDFRKLSPPPKQALDERATKVEQIIQQMGDKYRLHSTIQRKQ
jgi:hypothetical protein